MSANDLIVVRDVIAGQTVWLMAQGISVTTNTLYEQEDVTSLTMDVYNVTDVRTAISEGIELDKSDCVFDEAQVDGRWRRGSAGYNIGVSYTVPDVIGETYEVRLKVVDGDGYTQVAVWQLTTK